MTSEGRQKRDRGGVSLVLRRLLDSVRNYWDRVVLGLVLVGAVSLSAGYVLLTPEVFERLPLVSALLGVSGGPRTLSPGGESPFAIPRRSLPELGQSRLEELKEFLGGGTEEVSALDLVQPMDLGGSYFSGSPAAQEAVAFARMGKDDEAPKGPTARGAAGDGKHELKPDPARDAVAARFGSFQGSGSASGSFRPVGSEDGRAAGLAVQGAPVQDPRAVRGASLPKSRLTGAKLAPFLRGSVAFRTGPGTRQGTYTYSVSPMAQTAAAHQTGVSAASPASLLQPDGSVTVSRGLFTGERTSSPNVTAVNVRDVRKTSEPFVPDTPQCKTVLDQNGSEQAQIMEYIEEWNPQLDSQLAVLQKDAQETDGLVRSANNSFAGAGDLLGELQGLIEQYDQDWNIYKADRERIPPLESSLASRPTTGCPHSAVDQYNDNLRRIKELLTGPTLIPLLSTLKEAVTQILRIIQSIKSKADHVRGLILGEILPRIDRMTASVNQTIVPVAEELHKKCQRYNVLAREITRACGSGAEGAQLLECSTYAQKGKMAGEIGSHFASLRPQLQSMLSDAAAIRREATRAEGRFARETARLDGEIQSIQAKLNHWNDITEVERCRCTCNNNDACVREVRECVRRFWFICIDHETVERACSTGTAVPR